MNLNYIKPILETKLYSLGYDLYSISFIKENGSDVLKIVVDRVTPIDMNDIVSLTETVNGLLDEIDDSNDSYTLDLSSLGAEKPLKIEKLSDYVGSYVEVRLINPINGENIYLGTIKSNDEDSIILEIRIKSRIKEINITKSNISKIRLAIKF